MNQKIKILQLVRDAIQLDNELRGKYQVADKFRFIRDRLNGLATKVEENISAMRAEADKKITKMSEDETLIYVYLFNAEGLTMQTWQKMLTPSVFYEYSVNRPIYKEKAHVEAIVRSKANKALHGFLTIAVKKEDILNPPAGLAQPKDTIGNPVYKVKEGSLKIQRLVTFTHAENEYVLNEEGEMIKKLQ